jgi:hypothetical protein
MNNKVGDHPDALSFVTMDLRVQKSYGKKKSTEYSVNRAQTVVGIKASFQGPKPSPYA